MIPDEDIDSFFTRFADIVNPLMSLGRTFTQEGIGDKGALVLERNRLEEQAQCN